MNLNNPHELERYSFVWSEVRLIVAAIALFLGGVPPIYLIAPSSLFGLARSGLVICWIISGITSLYLLYRWHVARHTLFGKKDTKDTFAFLVLAVSGINLGLVALLGRNIGMSIASGKVVFLVTGVVYLVCAIYLYQRWNKSGQKIF